MSALAPRDISNRNMEDQRITKFHFALEIVDFDGHCTAVFDKMLSGGPTVSNQILIPTFP